MIKLLRKMYINFLSIFDREFVARALNIHHPSELSAWRTYNESLRKDYDEYCRVRDELRNWHWFMRKYGCETMEELEKLIRDLANRPHQELDELKADAELKSLELSKWVAKNRIPADPQYVDEWFRFKKTF